MKRVLYLFMLGVCLTNLSSCETVDLAEINNLQKGSIIKIGHGGVGFPSLIPFNYLPTNSISAFKKALDIDKADGVELDIHMTADFEFILYHDKKLDSKTKKAGYIEELTINQVEGTSYRLGFPYDFFQEEVIISLDSAIRYFKSLTEFPILQLDIRNYCEKFVSKDNDIWEEKMRERLIEKLDEYDLDPDRIHLITISKKMCLFFMNHSNYKVSYEINKIEEGLDWVIENEVHSVTIHCNNLTQEITKQAHEHVIEVIGFGTKSKSGNINLIKKNPDYIQTDNLSSLNTILSE